MSVTPLLDGRPGPRLRGERLAELHRIPADSACPPESQEPTSPYPSRRSRKWRVALALIATDLAAFATAGLLAATAAAVTREFLGVAEAPRYIHLAARVPELAMLSAMMVAVFSFGGLYTRSSWEMDEIQRIAGGVTLIALFDATMQFITKDHSSRLWFVFAYPMAGFLIITARMLLREVPVVRRASTSHVVLIGSGIHPDEMLHELRESRSGPVRLVDVLPTTSVDTRDPLDLDRALDRLARRERVAPDRIQVVLAPSLDELAWAEAAIDVLERLHRPYSMVVPVKGLARRGVSLTKVIGADMVVLEAEAGKPRPLGPLVKRVFDLSLAVPIILLASPLLLVILGALRAEGGPAIFSQTRVGRNRTRFRCHKFRTMRHDAEARLRDLLARDPAARSEWETYQKLTDDPRITRLGTFLRRTSLDELPQLFNVLKGEMSLVGPRPIIAPEIPGYPLDTAYYESPDFDLYARLTPGITGLWQVAGRASMSHDERIRLDGWYARNWSLWLDLMILFKTARAVIARSARL